MFVLRRITSEQNELNECLGDHYHLIIKTYNESEFKKCLEVLKWKDDDDELYGFVIFTQSNEMIHKPLYKKSRYFVMTESGKTFANISLK